MLRDEFCLKNIKLSYHRVDDFVESKWFPVPVVIVYRGALAVFCSTWIIYNVATFPINNQTFVFLTNWVYAFITTYFISSTIITSLHYVKGRQEQQHERLVNEPEFLDDNETVEQENNDETRWFHRVLWLLYTISSNMSICVTICYWSLIYNGEGVQTTDIFVHILNSIFMVLENVLGSMPLRLLHVIYPFVIGLVYSFITVLFWLLIDKSPIYPILDYSHKPVLAIKVLLGSHFVLLPIVQLFLYALYRIRNYLSTKYKENLD